LGLLQCASKNERTVRYALSGTTSSMAVAGYHYTELPAVEQAVMPSEAEMFDVLARTFASDGDRP
jgi:hypothetical protein